MKNMMKMITVLFTLALLCGCLPLASVSAVNDKLYSEEAQLYYTVEDGKVTIVQCDYKRSGAVVIPEEMDGYPVVAIGRGAFHLCKKITSVTVPAGVTTIAADAFNNCASLSSVKLPDSITSIGAFAFYNCNRLSSINMPADVTIIGERAFGNCKSLTSLDMPKGVLSIGTHAFDSCTNLVKVELPGCLKNMGSCAFSGCSSLTSLTISEGVTEIAIGAFGNCARLSEIAIPNSVTTVGHDAFLGTAAAKDTANWENGLLYIDGCLLAAEKNLTNVVIKNGTRLMAKNIFFGNSLTSVTIPESITTISYNAFYGCSSLTTVNLPKSVTVIEDYAFAGCAALTTVDYSGSRLDQQAIFMGGSNGFLLNAEWKTQEPPTTTAAPTTTTVPTVPEAEDTVMGDVTPDSMQDMPVVEDDAEDNDRDNDDTLSLWLWIALGIVAVLLIAGVVLFLLKKKSV